MLLLGTDEAGYGPNLGPLVIGISAWNVPDDVGAAGLDAYVADLIRRDPPPRRAVDDRLVIADSKQLYKPGLGLAMLEQQFHRALALAARPASSWRELWQGACVLGDGESGAASLDDAPWHAEYDEPLPVACGAVEPARGERLRDWLAERGVRLERIAARAVFPAEFNRRLDACGTKSHLLSTLTLELLCRVLRETNAPNSLAVCDKHGARNRYGPLLQPWVESWIEVLAESDESSEYRWRCPGGCVELHFKPRGESHLPTALASMTAKYLRELAMRAFNRFWQSRIPDLAPTAGYPQDARRFKLEIEATRRKLEIAEEILWRRK